VLKKDSIAALLLSFFKDAAIAWLGAQLRLASSAFVEELTGVSWHRFALGEAANRTSGC
jgi:hypothetical protein